MSYTPPTDCTDDPWIALERAVTFELARAAGDPAAATMEGNDVALEDYVLVGQSLFDGTFAPRVIDLIDQFGQDCTVAMEILRDSHDQARDALHPQEV